MHGRRLSRVETRTVNRCDFQPESIEFCVKGWEIRKGQPCFADKSVIMINKRENHIYQKVFKFRERDLAIRLELSEFGDSKVVSEDYWELGMVGAARMAHREAKKALEILFRTF